MRCWALIVAAAAVACAPTAAVEPWCDSGERPVFVDGDLVVPFEGRLLVNRDRNGRATLDVYPGASFPLAPIGAELRVPPDSPSIWLALFDADGLVLWTYTSGNPSPDPWLTVHAEPMILLPDDIELELRLQVPGYGGLDDYVLDRVTVAVKHHVDELP